MKLPSGTGAQHRFAEVPQANIERSAFDVGERHLFTFDPDYLYPFYIQEVLPGDSFVADSNKFIRMLSPLNKPIMDNMYLDTFWFFVPNRLLWSNFKKFMGEQATPASSISFTKPQVVADGSTGFVLSSLSDYFGLPLAVNSLSVDAQFHRAYNLIWNEWFRDQNIQDSVTVNLGDGPDAITDYTLLKRGKRHDYFTSCLPWAQKGTAVSLSLTGNAPVTGIGKANQSYNLTTQTAYEADGASHVYPFAYSIPNFDTFVKGNAATGAYPQIFANLSSVSAFTINALRLAFQTQKMLERDARGGTRYTEKIKAHFGVTSPDARLQRPEFLGGKSSNIQISTVPQTAPTSGASNNLGSLGAFALGTNTRDGFTKSFTEHGIIMGLLMVRADLTYQQGLDKKFTRSTQLDYYWPALAHIGEQAVLTKEIYCDGSATDAVVFGYQERYAEYRYGRNRISGLFRSTAASTLDVWHLAQKFASAPTLSDTFIKETMPVTRIEFVTTQPAFAVDCFNQVKAIRPMPVYSVPEKMDWF